jgi:ABC-type transport system substrate-binding protein
VLNRQTVLKRNPYYRGDRPVHVDQMTITVGLKADDCELAIEQDRLDTCLVTILRLPDATRRRIMQQYGINKPGGQFFLAPGSSTWYFAFNHDRPAFKGPGQIPLAKAINYAIDRPALARAFGYLTGRRDDQMLPPALEPDASIYPLGGADPATALKWLRRAKLKPSTLVLYTWAGPAGAAAAGDFKFELKQIGIDVEVKTYEQRTLGEKVGTRGEPFDVVLWGWGWDYPDGGSFFVPLLRALHPTDNGNVSYFDDPKTDATIAKASRLTGDARRTAWAKLDVDLMRNNPPWAPFIHTTLRAFVSKSYGCFLFHPTYSGGFVGDLATACKK